MPIPASRGSDPGRNPCASPGQVLSSWPYGGFGVPFGDCPQPLGVLRSTSRVGLGEAVVTTFGNIIAAKERAAEARGLELGEARGEARGLELGEARGEKRILVQFVAEFWSDNEAARFAQQLDGAAPGRFPAIADLMRDQAAGRLPRLRYNSCTKLGK